ncbi:MAG: shikimate dehydrogenase [Hyphomonadaceae bacterium]
MTNNTRKFAVIGNPVAHSLSPQMHNAWIADHGLDALYERIHIDGDDAAFADFIASADLAGANVTVPFKAAAWRAATQKRADEEVANVLTWLPGGALRADNTDGLGFIAALDEAAPGWAARKVLMIGAGGAAAGVARALAQTPRVITLVNRTRARAEELAASLSSPSEICVAPWEALGDQFATADLIVQTTTLGMGANESPAWPVARCKPGAIVVDIVYKPLRTPLLQAAAARGLTAVDGLGMLIHQGALAFEIWFGIKPDTKKARARLIELLGERA